MKETRDGEEDSLHPVIVCSIVLLLMPLLLLGTGAVFNAVGSLLAMIWVPLSLLLTVAATALSLGLAVAGLARGEKRVSVVSSIAAIANGATWAFLAGHMPIVWGY